MVLRAPSTSAISPQPAEPGAGAPAEIPDCRSCGACCHGDDSWVHLFADDDARMAAAALRRLTVLTEHGRGYFARSMRMEGGRCVAFRDNLGDGGCGCSIYESRPQVCRELAAGSADCHAARRRRGLEPGE